MKANLLKLCFAMLCVTAHAIGIEHVYVRVPARMLTPEFVRETKFNRDHGHDDVYAFGYLTEDAYHRLSEATRERMVTLDAHQWARFPHDPKTLEMLWEPEENGPFEDYHTYSTLTTELNVLAQNFPQLVTLRSAGKSVRGRELWYLRLTSPRYPDTNKPQLLYISSMHGDEVTGKEMMIYFVRELLAKYGSDARITALLDYGDLYVMPSMNPDGTELKQRFNAEGVDLNRNFSDPWEPEVTGKEAVETRAIIELFRSHKFLLALNFHGGTLCINIPWDHKPNPADGLFGDNAVMMLLAREYARLNQPMLATHGGSFDHGVTYGYEWYEVLGGMQDWSIHFHDLIHATLEISHTKWPSASQLPKFWTENREAVLSYFERGLDGVHLKVVDDKGAPVNVSVDVNTAKRTLRYEDGVVHRITIPGQQEVTLRAMGFADKTLTLPATRFNGSYQTVVMGK